MICGFHFHATWRGADLEPIFAELAAAAFERGASDVCLSALECGMGGVGVAAAAAVGPVVGERAEATFLGGVSGGAGVLSAELILDQAFVARDGGCCG